MLKKSLLLGGVSGILAGVASIIYQKVYAASLGVDFANIAKPQNIIIASLVTGLIAGTGYWLLTKWLKTKGEVIFNFLFTILSFASIAGAFGAKLPFDVDMPELFPGLVVPMHFFPALAWFTLKPTFIKNAEPYRKVFA
ncbi:MAG: hypothetical protein ABIN94_15445 [Ferruginibacter sp.]